MLAVRVRVRVYLRLVILIDFLTSILHLCLATMFAVPGWSVSADTLKAQLDPRLAKNAEEAQPGKSNGPDRKSKKRKRGPGSIEITDITEHNLGDLWRKHIEGESVDKPIGETGGTTERRQKKRKRGRSGVLEDGGDANGYTFGDFPEGEANHLKKTELPLEQEREKRHRAAEHEESEICQATGDVQTAEDRPSPAKIAKQEEDGRAKYERRRANVARKKEQKALRQADGTLPPTRPEASLNVTATITANKFSRLKNGEPADTTVPSKQAIPISSHDPSSPPNPSKGSKAPTESTASIPPTPPLSAIKLTPLQQRMAAKLTSARFRHLNQTLYTSPSNEAVQLFADSPQAYTSYHAGFRAQVAVWPQNPVEGFIEDLKLRGKMVVQSQKKMFRDVKKGKKGKAHMKDAGSAGGDEGGRQSDPLPRTRGACTIADLGCGDAHLAESLQPLKQALSLNILSFDLAKGDTPSARLVTVADISNLAAAGVRDGIVDIAICCLSLMGTNWVEVVGECARAMRAGGEFWVAEIKSRFARPGRGKNKGDGIGKTKVRKGEGNDDGVEAEEAVALEELEDATGSKDETDVSAFVEVFRKRGFHLKGEPDMANKMFVRLRFIKATRPEKAVENEKGGKASFGQGFRGKQVGKTKFLDGEAEAEVDENKVLKPCIYKTR